MAHVYVSSTFKDLEECCEKVGREHTLITVFKVIMLATLMVLNVCASVAIAADNNITSVANVVEIHGPVHNGSDLPAKLVLDENAKYTLKTGTKIDLGSGYSLTAKQVDVDGKKVWLELDKDGQYVDDQVLDISNGNATWTCKLGKIQGEDNVVVLKVHVNQVFQGAVGNVVQINSSVTTAPSGSEPNDLTYVENYLDKYVQDAQIIFTPSEKMTVGETGIFKAYITRNTSENIFRVIEENGTLRYKNINVTPTMKLTLVGKEEGAFYVETIPKDFDGVYPIVGEKLTNWTWKVTPHKSGKQTLILSAYYVISSSPGESLTYNVKEVDEEITVDSSIKDFLDTHWQWIIGTLIALISALGIGGFILKKK